MTHALGDYREWDTFGFGGRGPAVTGNVKGQRDGDTDHSGDTFEIVVDVIAGVPVGTSFVCAGIADDRQKVVGGVFMVFVENHLHFLCPFDYELLAGLSATIGDIAVFEV